MWLNSKFQLYHCRLRTVSLDTKAKVLREIGAPGKYSHLPSCYLKIPRIDSVVLQLLGDRIYTPFFFFFFLNYEHLVRYPSTIIFSLILR